MIQLNEHFVEHINKEANQILNLIQEFTNVGRENNYNKGSIKERPALELAPLSDKPSRKSKLSITGKRIDFKECYQGKCYGFDEKGYEIVLKFIKKIHRRKEINQLISFDCILDFALDWFMKSYKQNISQSFDLYIVNQMNNEVKEYVISFPVLYLELEGKLKLGNTLLHFYTQNEIDALKKHYEPKVIKYLEKELKGQVIISHQVKAEKKKAKEIAYKECSLSIDVLKLCSITSFVPDYKIVFDIDVRTTKVSSSQVIYQQIPDSNSFQFEITPNSNFYILDTQTWMEIQNDITLFHSFLLNKDLANTELTNLIIRSIKIYASAISDDNLNQRIVNLFTIPESLLLKDSDVGVLDSLKKYLPKLIATEANERVYIKKLITKMYSIRSAMVHHAKEKDFEMKSLKELQLMITSLIISLIIKTNTHQKMDTILQEIDDAIEEAY